MQRLTLLLSLALISLSSAGWAAPEGKKTKAPSQTSSTKPQAGHTLTRDSQRVLEQVKLARMWLQQKDSGEAIRQIRNAIRLLRQMQTNLTKPLQKLIETNRNSSLTNKGAGNLQALEQALAELTIYAGTLPDSQQTRIKQMKSHLGNIHKQLQAKQEKGAKDTLKLLDIELAGFELDLPITYAEVRLRQAYRLLLDGAVLPADQELQAVEKHLIENGAKAASIPATQP
jgi:hypothetical protein